MAATIIRPVIVVLRLLCGLFDRVFYSPLLIRAQKAIGRSSPLWSCQLAKMSISIDERFGAKSWGDFGPLGLCQVCEWREAWLLVELDDVDYVACYRCSQVVLECRDDEVEPTPNEVRRRSLGIGFGKA